MAFKLIESAQDRWRAVNASHLAALVRAGATFVNGKLIERPDEEAQPQALKDLDPQVLTIAPFPQYDLYRKQVVKQADLVPAMVLRGGA
jgi:hypothetical protein